MAQINSTSIKENKNRNLWIKIGVVVGIIAIFAVILPFVIPAFRLKLLGRFLALSITALGIDLIWGYTGLLSLGHGIFFGLGGYIFAMYLNLQIPEGQLPSFFTLYNYRLFLLSMVLVNCLGFGNPLTVFRLLSLPLWLSPELWLVCWVIWFSVIVLREFISQF